MCTYIHLDEKDIYGPKCLLLALAVRIPRPLALWIL